MTKKFSIKKLVAGVLAAAMVVTALPVSGLSAKAAEADTKPVYVLYDANRGEHYFTADAGEKDGLLAIGWKEGNIAWMSPAKSNTPVYGLYNPNNGGDHYYTADANEKNGLLAAGWKEGDVKFYSDDEKGVLINTLYNPNEVVRNHHYTASLDEVNGLVALGWQNHTNAATAIYGVGAEVSGVVSLTDVNGFQADDTGLVGDKLQIVFGASFGVPKSVAWYKNGAAVATATENLSPDNGLALTIEDTAILGAGDYYAQVENTQGKVYKTNTVTIVDEGAVILSDFAVADNYEALATYGEDVGDPAAYIVPCVAKTKWAVVDITLNKLYTGRLAIVEYEDGMEKIPEGAGNQIAISQTGLTGFVDVKKQSDLTNAVLYDKCINRSDNKYKAHGIYYKDKNDKYHIKALADLSANISPASEPSKALTRGTSYVAVFKDGASAIAEGDKLEDLVVSKPATCPYLMKPTKVVVEGRQSATDTLGWKAQLYVGDTIAGYINGGNENANADATGLTPGELTLYASDNQDKSEKQGFNTVATTIKKGAVENCGHDDVKNYVWATYESDDDVFGEEPVKLESDVVEVAFKPATEMKLKESGDDAKDAVVEFTALKQKASGTVYILQGDGEKNTFDEIKEISTDDAVASAKVAGGSEKVTVKKAFSKIDSDGVKNMFVAVFVPDDNETYSKLAGATKDDYGDDEVFTLVAKPTTFTMEKATVTGTTGSAVAANVTSRVNDQFGKKITTALEDEGFIGTYEMTALKVEGTTKSATLTISAGTQAGKASIAFITYNRQGEEAINYSSDEDTKFYAKTGDVYTILEKTGNPNEWTISVSTTKPE